MFQSLAPRWANLQTWLHWTKRPHTPLLTQFAGFILDNRPQHGVGSPEYAFAELEVIASTIEAIPLGQLEQAYLEARSVADWYGMPQQPTMFKYVGGRPVISSTGDLQIADDWLGWQQQHLYQTNQIRDWRLARWRASPRVRKGQTWEELMRERDELWLIGFIAVQLLDPNLYVPPENLPVQTGLPIVGGPALTW